MKVTNTSLSWDFFELIEANPVSVIPHTGTTIPGPVSYNFYTNQLQVNNGSAWYDIPGQTFGVGLTPRAHQALKWAESAMIRDQQRTALEEQYPALKEAREHYETLLGLVQNQ
jgi:hypothetical protein